MAQDPHEGGRRCSASRLGRRDDTTGADAVYHNLEGRRHDQDRSGCELAGVAGSVNRVAYQVDAVGVRLPGADGSRPALDDISFEVATGEIVGVVGRSGVGKTTLLRVLGGLLEASCGTVIFDGKVL